MLANKYKILIFSNLYLIKKFDKFKIKKKSSYLNWIVNIILYFI